MDIERAKEIAARSHAWSVWLVRGGERVPFPEGDLEEILAANRIVGGLQEQTGEAIVVYWTVAPALLAAGYLYADMERLPLLELVARRGGAGDSRGRGRSS